MKKSFIDCHCHVFNLVDVPMYLTILDKIKMGTIRRFRLAIGGNLYLAINIFNRNGLENKLDDYKEFILFFERSVERNIEFILNEIRETMNNDLHSRWNENDEIIITPLIMDFDIVLKKEMPNDNLKEPTVIEQYNRLQEAIKKVTLTSNTKVCPFIGFDLRKLFEKDEFQNLQTFWTDNNTFRKDKLESGKLLGIKLYPPLGFNPCPKDGLPIEYKNFYLWCCKEDIPITVHTQKDSYEVGADKEKSDMNTTPENWEQLFIKNNDLKNLRINFAHFGGEGEVKDIFNNIFTEIDKNSWTYIIIKLLKNYPNTYADISAYDYSEEKYRQNLAKVFEYDNDGKFGDGHKLEDKLLWGSDIPMVISDKSYRKDFKQDREAKYEHYFKGFLEAIKNLRNKEKIIENLTEKNPKKFLRLK